jgi:FixJ family two-component response regulator
MPNHRIVNASVATASRAQESAAARTLSRKERAVVAGLADGRAPKQLAVDCGVSLATIRCHIQSAKRKTSARTLAQLVAITSRRGDPLAR